MQTEPLIEISTRTDEKVVASAVVTYVEDGQIVTGRRYLSGSLPAGDDHGFAYFQAAFDTATSFRSREHFTNAKYHWRSQSVDRRYAVMWDSLEIEKITRTTVTRTTTTEERVLL